MDHQEAKLLNNLVKEVAAELKNIRLKEVASELKNIRHLLETLVQSLTPKPLP